MANPMLFEALREFTTGLFNQLLVNLAGQDGQRWLEEFKKFLRQEACWTAEVVQQGKKAVRRLTCALFSGVKFGPRSGVEGEGATAVFTGYCDPQFIWGEVDQPEEEIAVDVEEMTVNGTYRQIFNGFDRSLDQLAMSRSQIAAFCVTHRDKLRGSGYGTFFLFKKGEKFFVADVYVDVDGQLGVGVISLEFDGVWLAEYRGRLVVPQRNLGSLSA